MDSKQFINYIVDKYTFEYESGPRGLDDVSLALIRNALDYIDSQEFIDAEDARVHLWSLLDGAFGIER